MEGVNDLMSRIATAIQAILPKKYKATVIVWEEGNPHVSAVFGNASRSESVMAMKSRIARDELTLQTNKVSFHQRPAKTKDWR